MLITQTLKSGCDWSLYYVPFIAENKDSFVYDLNVAHKNFKNVFRNVDSSLTRKQEITLGDLPSILNVDDDSKFIENEINNGEDLSGYSFYNIYNLTSPSPYFFELYNVFRNIIKLHLGNRPIWFQSWMNFHTPDTVLDWHDHDWAYHGYISIDPHNTTTKFKDKKTNEMLYEIDNKPGQIYFGPGHRIHKVFVNENFDKPRLTLGYDISLTPSEPDAQFSLLPLL